MIPVHQYDKPRVHQSDPFVLTGRIDLNSTMCIIKFLRQDQIKAGYTDARVYDLNKHKYFKSPLNRSGQTLSFQNPDIAHMLEANINNQLPEGFVFVKSPGHMDLARYGHGQNFKKHRDYVQGETSGASVTCIVGLKKADEGGTRLWLDDGPKTFNQSITRSGLLIFESSIEHSGEAVRGVKEILTLNGYIMKTHDNQDNLITHISKDIKLQHIDNFTYIIVMRASIATDAQTGEYDDENNIESESYTVYIYYNKYLVCIIKQSMLHKSFKYEVPCKLLKIESLNKEEFKLFNNGSCGITEDSSPIFEDDIATQITELCKYTADCVNKKITEHTVSDVLCNGPGGFDETQYYTTMMKSARGAIEVYNSAFIKELFSKTSLTDLIVCIIIKFLSLRQRDKLISKINKIIINDLINDIKNNK